jgi:hypothetical protein
MSALRTEAYTRVAPLGMRFVDQATGQGVRDGLTVTTGGRTAGVNPVDVHLLNRLPGLRTAEWGAGDAGYWDPPPTQRTFQVRVRDEHDRYLPFSFVAEAPTRGLFELGCVAPVGVPSPGAVPLHSGPARTPPPGLAVVRAELRVASSGNPASFARLDVAGPGGAPGARGIADAQGRVVVLLPYPPPPASLAPATHALESARWDVSVAVHFRAGAASGPFPDLCSVLGQPPVTALSSRSPDTPLSSAQLAYGQELVLSTDGEHVLLVNP